MNDARTIIQFCGFGGQGIVLASVIFGTAAVTRAGLEAVQTQSYGSEARGGECQAEVIISAEPIVSPLADEVTTLVAMSQQALDKYLPRLTAGGMLLYDPEFVSAPARDDVRAFMVAATATAAEAGNKLAANMVMLGYLQHATGLFTSRALEETIRAGVKPATVALNLNAARKGMALAQAANGRKTGE